MYCCVNCFDDVNIIEKIASYEEEGDCDYCRSKDVLVVDTGELGEFIREKLLNGYENATRADIPYGALQSYATTIEDVLRNGECIFSVLLEGQDNAELLLNDLFKDSGPSWHDIAQGDDDYWEGGLAEVVRRDEFYGLDYNSYKISWEQFTYIVKHVNRFFDVGSSESRETLLDVIGSFFSSMTIELSTETEIWRARTDPKNQYETWEEKTKECGPPPREYAKALRMNPAGISYFYGAENKNTCYQEIRGSSSKTIIYGLFNTKRKLKLLDLSEAPNIKVPSLFSNDYDHELNWAREFFISFCSEVSKPIADNIAPIEYIPTQILSEYIRKRGYDGVRYLSSLTGDYNYTLFCGPPESETYHEPWQLHIEDIQIPIYTDWLELKYFEETKK